MFLWIVDDDEFVEIYSIFVNAISNLGFLIVYLVLLFSLFFFPSFLLSLHSNFIQTETRACKCWMRHVEIIEMVTKKRRKIRKIRRKFVWYYVIGKNRESGYKINWPLRSGSVLFRIQKQLVYGENLPGLEIRNKYKKKPLSLFTIRSLYRYNDQLFM